MPISVQCVNCGKQPPLPDELAGKTIRCRKCGSLISVPLATQNPTIEREIDDDAFLAGLDDWTSEAPAGPSLTPARKSPTYRAPRASGKSRSQKTVAKNDSANSRSPWVLLTVGVISLVIILAFGAAWMLRKPAESSHGDATAMDVANRTDKVAVAEPRDEAANKSGDAANSVAATPIPGTATSETSTERYRFADDADLRQVATTFDCKASIRNNRLVVERANAGWVGIAFTPRLKPPFTFRGKGRIRDGLFLVYPATTQDGREFPSLSAAEAAKELQVFFNLSEEHNTQASIGIVGVGGVRTNTLQRQHFLTDDDQDHIFELAISPKQIGFNGDKGTQPLDAALPKIASLSDGQIRIAKYVDRPGGFELDWIEVEHAAVPESTTTKSDPLLAGRAGNSGQDDSEPKASSKAKQPQRFASREERTRVVQEINSASKLKMDAHRKKQDSKFEELSAIATRFDELTAQNAKFRSKSKKILAELEEVTLERDRIRKEVNDLLREGNELDAEYHQEVFELVATNPFPGDPVLFKEDGKWVEEGPDHPRLSEKALAEIQEKKRQREPHLKKIEEEQASALLGVKEQLDTKRQRFDLLEKRLFAPQKGKQSSSGPRKKMSPAEVEMVTEHDRLMDEIRELEEGYLAIQDRFNQSTLEILAQFPLPREDPPFKHNGRWYPAFIETALGKVDVRAQLKEQEENEKKAVGLAQAAKESGERLATWVWQNLSGDYGIESYKLKSVVLISKKQRRFVSPEQHPVYSVSPNNAEVELKNLLRDPALDDCYAFDVQYVSQAGIVLRKEGYVEVGYDRNGTAYLLGVSLPWQDNPLNGRLAVTRSAFDKALGKAFGR